MPVWGLGLAVVMAAQAQDASFEEFHRTGEDVLRRTEEFQLAREVAQELGVKVVLYGGSARDVMLFVRRMIDEGRANELKTRRSFRLTDMLGTPGSDMDLIATGRQEELERRLMERRPPKGEFYRWEVKPVSKLDNEVERTQGRNTVDKILLGLDEFDVSPRVAQWSNEGVADAYRGLIRYVTSDDYFKSPQYLEGVHDEFFEVLRAVRFTTGYKGVTPAPETLVNMRAAMGRASARSQEIKERLNNGLFMRRLRINVSKMFEQSVDPQETERLAKELGIESLLSRIGLEHEYKVARFGKSYAPDRVERTYRDETGQTRDVPVEPAPKRVFYHWTKQGVDYQIETNGFLPSEGGEAGRGVYLAGNATSSKGRGVSLVEVALDPERTRGVDITQGEGKRIWDAFVAQNGTRDVDAFAARYGYDLVRYDAINDYYVLKNSGPYAYADSSRGLGRLLRSLATDPLPERTVQLAQFRKAQLPWLKEEVASGRQDLSIRRLMMLLPYEERLRDVLVELEGGQPDESLEKFREEASGFLREFAELKRAVVPFFLSGGDVDAQLARAVGTWQTVELDSSAAHRLWAWNALLKELPPYWEGMLTTVLPHEGSAYVVEGVLRFAPESVWGSRRVGATVTKIVGETVDRPLLRFFYDVANTKGVFFAKEGRSAIKKALAARLKREGVTAEEFYRRHQLGMVVPWHKRSVVVQEDMPELTPARTRVHRFAGSSVDPFLAEGSFPVTAHDSSPTPQATERVNAGTGEPVEARAMASVRGMVAREMAGAGRFGAAYVIKEAMTAAERLDVGEFKRAVLEMKQPMFWAGLGAFSGASQLTDWGLRWLPGRLNGFTRAWLPLAAGMAAMQGLSGRFSASDLAWSTGTFLMVGTVVDVVARTLVGPGGWWLGVAKLAGTLYGAEKLEGIRSKLGGLRP